VDEYEGAEESACKVLGDDGAEEVLELPGEIIGLYLVVLDLERDFAYDEFCVTNEDCEWDRRKGLDEK